jgi:hypothetical protein
VAILAAVSINLPGSVDSLRQPTYVLDLCSFVAITTIIASASFANSGPTAWDPELHFCDDHR